MQIYFFRLNDDSSSDLGDGIECQDDEAAQWMAMRTLAAITTDELRRGCDEQCATIFVTDEYNNAVYSARMVYFGGSMRRKVQI